MQRQRWQEPSYMSDFPGQIVGKGNRTMTHKKRIEKLEEKATPKEPPQIRMVWPGEYTPEPGAKVIKMTLPEDEPAPVQGDA